MSLILNRGRELIKINERDRCQILYSTNEGRSWYTRYSGRIQGEFIDLVDNGREILAQTEKGLYYSTNEGRSWFKRN